MQKQDSAIPERPAPGAELRRWLWLFLAAAGTIYAFGKVEQFTRYQAFTGSDPRIVILWDRREHRVCVAAVAVSGGQPALATCFDETALEGR